MLSERTIHEYRGVLANGLIDGRRLNEDRIATWGPSRIVVLRAALKWKGLLIDVPKPARKRRRKDLAVPVEVELQRIEKEADELPPGRRELALMPLLVGLRAQELLELPRRAIERAVDVGELVLTRKGDYEARLPVEHVTQLLKALLRTPAVDGKPWRTAGDVLSLGGRSSRYCALRRLIRGVGHRAGIRGLRPHLLRHAFATRLVRDGAPLAVVQRWLGHSSIFTTQIYVHPETADLAKYVRRGR